LTGFSILWSGRRERASRTVFSEPHLYLRSKSYSCNNFIYCTYL
jgi:hypothetical protein